jgi:apolipoprotein N-acyltransferase
LTVPASLKIKGRWFAGLAGCLLPLSFAPFHLYGLAPVLLAGLFFLWDGQQRREAAWRGFWFGFGAFAAGTYWLYISIHVFGGAPLWVAVLLMLGLVWLMAMYTAVCGYLVVTLSSGSVVLRWCVVWPACWTLLEWLRGWLFSGFPWLSIGYGQIDGPLRAWAPVAGMFGVSLATVMIAGVLLTLVRGNTLNRKIAAAIAAVIVGSTWLIHDRDWTSATDQDLRVRLIQGSISQDRKWLPEQLQPTLELYTELTFTTGDSQFTPDLTVWPEVAVPAIAYRVQDFLDNVAAEAGARGMQIFLGVLTYDFDDEQIRNSLIAIGEQSGAYHKRHLVPFGEFFPVPAFVREWMRMSGMPSQDTVTGERIQELLRVGDIQLAPSICYEDVFGSEQLDFLPAAEMLVNVSNDAWFGDSVAPHQHLQMARMRALEAGRFMLRATNTGVTAVISPRGTIVHESPQFETHVLDAVVQPYVGQTPYMRMGNYAVVVICLVFIGVAVYRSRSRQNRSQ